MGAAFTFPKSARLLTRPEFLAVREKGRSFADGPLAASYLPRARVPTRPRSGDVAEAWARVGLTVSSKVGGSVVRSAVKRRLREAVRYELSRLPAIDLVLVARASSTKATVAELRAWLTRAARRMT